jgi:glutamate/aspartate transport system substrate-binding protein
VALIAHALQQNCLYDQFRLLYDRYQSKSEEGSAMALRCFVMALALCALPGHAGAEELAGTLKKIKETGVITIGYRETSIPFSYLDENNKPVGFSLDICARIVDAVKKDLKNDKIETKYVPVTSSTRIPLLQNGAVDLECGSTTNNAERAKQVAFTHAHFLSESKYVTKKTSGVASIADLKGKTVASTAGTTSVKFVNARNKAEDLGLTVLAAKEHAEGFLNMETDRAVAFIMDDILLAGLVANAKDPSLYVISSDAFSKAEPYGIMLPKDDAPFKKVVDGAVAAVLKSEGQALYAKWFESPIPPRGVNLNLPLSPVLKKQFENPIDSPDPEAYQR